MNYGLPIVGSNYGHINDYINKENVGISVNPDKPEEIGKALIMILEDRAMYNSFSENGEKVVDKKYNWSIIEDKLFKIYSDLLA